MNQSTPKAPIPICYYPQAIGTRGIICLRFGCSPVCVNCIHGKAKNAPSCYAALPGFPEDCVSTYYSSQCKLFCKYANNTE